MNFFDELEAVKTALLLNVLIPFKRFLLSLPWIGVVALLALAGYGSSAAGGWRCWCRPRPLHRRHRATGPRP